MTNKELLEKMEEMHLGAITPNVLDYICKLEKRLLLEMDKKHLIEQFINQLSILLPLLEKYYDVMTYDEIENNNGFLNYFLKEIDLQYEISIEKFG